MKNWRWASINGDDDLWQILYMHGYCISHIFYDLTCEAAESNRYGGQYVVHKQSQCGGLMRPSIESINIYCSSWLRWIVINPFHTHTHTSYVIYVHVKRICISMRQFSIKSSRRQSNNNAELEWRKTLIISKTQTYYQVQVEYIIRANQIIYGIAVCDSTVWVLFCYCTTHAHKYNKSK